MAYATAFAFVQAYGRRETAQLLADEELGLIESVLIQCILVKDPGCQAEWSNYKPDPLPERPTTEQRLRYHAWLVFRGEATWDDYTPVPVGSSAPTQAQIDAADGFVSAAMFNAEMAYERLSAALELSSQEIDSALRGRYDLPFDPALVASSLLDECCWVLARCRLADDCDNSTKKIESDCDKKRAWLDAVARGRYTLAVASKSASKRIITGKASSAYSWGSHALGTGSMDKVRP